MEGSDKKKKPKKSDIKVDQTRVDSPSSLAHIRLLPTYAVHLRSDGTGVKNDPQSVEPASKTDVE